MASKPVKRKENLPNLFNQKTQTQFPMEPSQTSTEGDKVQSASTENKFQDLMDSDQLKVVDIVFKKFFKRLEKTTFNIKSNTGTEENSQQRKEFAERSKNIDITRNSYTAIDNEPTSNQNKNISTSKTEVEMKLSEYPGLTKEQKDKLNRHSSLTKQKK